MTVSVRYLVDDVAAAIDFYTSQLEFKVAMHPAPGFAALDRGELRLLLNQVGGRGGASQRMPDGTLPAPGGWNRVQLEVDDLDAHVDRLREAGVHLRNQVVEGTGGRQVLVDDPSGNAIELFEPRASAPS